MTVSTQVSRNEYTGNGATTQYDFTFRILDKSHLLVQTLDDAENITTLTLGSNYSVTGVNRYNGGKVVLTSALPAGYKISIERKTPVTQETSICNQGGFFPEIHEDAFDKLTMLVQQAYGWWSGLSLRKPSWLANYYDALNNRIRNLRDPSQAQDAATKNYVDSQIVDNTNAWKEGDRVLDQKIDANFRRTIRVPESDVEMVPPVAERKDSLFGWNSSGRPVPIFSMTETADLALKLASDIGAYFSGYKARTVYDRLSDKVTLTDYPGAVEGRDNDSTAAFVAAYATGRFVYVPAGDWSTSVYIPNQTFGEGRVWSDGDGLFPDAGERVITPGISHQRNYLYRAETWGNRERAAGWSLMVNNEDGRPAVSGFSSDNAMAYYVNFDQVALFVSMRGSRKFFYTTAANTTYTEFTVTAPEITSEQEVKPGMLISTSHSPRFKGRVMAVDFDTNTIAVSRWVAEGNGADGQIPASGVRALINGADKLWAGNFNLFIDANSPAKTACGLEIDIISDGTHGNPIEGYTAVNANNLGNPFNYGFRAIGSWLYTVYADAKQNVGLLHVEPPTSAVRVDNLTSSSWAGSTVLLNTNYRQAASYLAKIITGGVTHFSIDSRGQRSVQREAYGVVNSDVTLNGRSPGEISCTNDVAVEITITLSSENCVPGQIFNIRARDGSVLVAGFTLNNTNGRFISILYDGTSFIKRFQSN
ncbi:phage tail fiber domain-containing protein [Klebsiella quasipneumoniae]|uniref:phage tail fiber domain-containing protein n=1 Tax=Klebsiella quasipneumoniae TaxID=1463165 RepID=UPI002B05F257|nr:phage tail fiber protein [Klebsiella quasipneumoniae]